MADVSLTRRPTSDPPTESALEAIFREQGLRPSWWSNEPGDCYGAHSHTYHKVLYCARGSIRFDLPSSSESFELHAEIGSTFRRAHRTQPWLVPRV